MNLSERPGQGRVSSFSRMQLPITTLTSTTWAGSLYCHLHSLVATDTWLSCTKIPWPLSANMVSLICSSPWPATPSGKRLLARWSPARLLMTALIWSHAFLLANYSTCWTSFWRRAFLVRWWLTFMSLSGRREACPMHTFCSFCTPIINHEGPMNTTAWCLLSCLIRMHTPFFLRSLQVACCMAPVAPSTHIALAWLTAFVQKATLRPLKNTPPTPPAPTQHTAVAMMATHLNGKCVGSRTMHLD